MLRFQDSAIRLVGLERPVEVGLFLPDESWVGLLSAAPNAVVSQSTDSPSTSKTDEILRVVKSALESSPGARLAQVIASIDTASDPPFEFMVAQFNLAIKGNRDVSNWRIAGYEHISYVVKVWTDGVLTSYDVKPE